MFSFGSQEPSFSTSSPSSSLLLFPSSFLELQHPLGCCLCHPGLWAPQVFSAIFLFCSASHCLHHTHGRASFPNLHLEPPVVTVSYFTCSLTPGMPLWQLPPAPGIPHLNNPSTPQVFTSLPPHPHPRSISHLETILHSFSPLSLLKQSLRSMQSWLNPVIAWFRTVKCSGEKNQTTMK